MNWRTDARACVVLPDDQTDVAGASAATFCLNQSYGPKDFRLLEKPVVEDFHQPRLQVLILAVGPWALDPKFSRKGAPPCLLLLRPGRGRFRVPDLVRDLNFFGSSDFSVGKSYALACRQRRSCLAGAYDCYHLTYESASRQGLSSFDTHTKV